MFRKVLYIAGGLFFIIAITAAVVLGFWAYRLNSQLEQAHADYQALQSDYDSLSAEYSQAQADFDAKSTQADADLKDATAQVTNLENEVTKLENEVKRLESQNNQLQTRMAEIQDNVAMLSDFWFTSESNFERKVNASDDEELKKLFANLQESQKWDDYVELMSYMIQNIDDASKVSWLPLEDVNALRSTGASR